MKVNTKTRRKIALFLAVLFIGIGVPAFSQTGIPNVGDLTQAMDVFAESMARALPFNASMGLNWSDAYIGKFFPSLPPHFGIGISGGFTTMKIDPIMDLLDIFGFPEQLPEFGGLPIPGAMVEGRLGGLFLPFDIGLKVGYLPFNPGPFDRVDYLLVGADIRYALLEGNVILPKVSVGMGLNYLSGGIERRLGRGIEISYRDLDGPQILGIEAPNLSVQWSTATLDLKAQVSKQIFIVTPYLGIGASHGWSKVSYGLDAEITTNGNLEQAKEIFRQYGIDIDEEMRRLSSELGIGGWSFRAFGGVSVNLLLFRLDFTGLWDIRDNNFGATMGARIQI